MMKRVSILLLCLCLLPVLALAEETSAALLPQPGITLRINEIMASNHETLEDSFGKTPDWVELYNAGDTACDLSGMALSDKKSELDRYEFPNGTVLQPGEYLIVFASGLKRNVADELHTPFKLSAKGENLYLTQNGTLVDMVSFPAMGQDVSYARDEAGVFQLTSSPTPMAQNVITPAEEADHDQ